MELKGLPAERIDERCEDMPKRYARATARSDTSFHTRLQKTYCSRCLQQHQLVLEIPVLHDTASLLFRTSRLFSLIPKPRELNIVLVVGTPHQPVGISFLGVFVSGWRYPMG